MLPERSVFECSPVDLVFFPKQILCYKFFPISANQFPPFKPTVCDLLTIYSANYFSNYSDLMVGCCGEMKFRQRIAWLGIACYLVLTILVVYYIFELSDTFNVYALEHVHNFHETVSTSYLNSAN